ncbi:LytR/AlgR family response regulator transcription factor [Alteromonas facilis]|uniref:LytR/AlgR family response regulator transcription factor n=1 Tax=Alteromonas facilis TaxID=2048004 RepID=UPI000C28537A|nr:LytTR family DNA-binding domain-containing protein [Alteromonas facilis]
MINVLIVDDEPLARQSIESLLADTPQIGQVFQAETGNEALLIAEQHNIHIAFLDMQMPGMSGIAVARELPENCARIFVTAYDQFALPAFEVNALDYVLKPFSNRRFTQALERALASVEPTLTQDTNVSTPKEPVTPCYKTRLVVRDPGRIRLIDVDTINFITGAGNYAELHLNDGKTVLHRETMTHLEEQLDPAHFIRIHRSSIVRRTFVSELRPNEKGDYTVILASGDLLTLSRRNKDKIEALTG